MSTKLTDKELANVLVALRTLQYGIEGFGDYSEHPCLDGHELMTPQEIDDLCEKINVVNDDPPTCE